MINIKMESANTAFSDSSLKQLHRWLQFEKYSWVLAGVIIWLPYHIIITGITVIAELFTPFLIWHLYHAQWYSSITVFGFAVMLPFALSQLIPVENTVIALLLSVFPLFTFYIYTWILGLMIEGYLSDLSALREIEFQQKIKQARNG